MNFFLSDIGFLFGSDKRQKLIKQLAIENHWKFVARRRYKKDPIHTFDFQLFASKSSKRLQSVSSFKVRALAGSFRIYDLHYSGSIGSNTTTVFEYYQKEMTLPKFTIQPKPGFGFLKSLFNEEEAPVILTATPSFLEQYQIATRDDFKLKENLTEEFLDRFGDEKNWAVEGNQTCMIYYQYGEQIPVTKLLERLEVYVHLIYDLENGKTFLR